MLRQGVAVHRRRSNHSLGSSNNHNELYSHAVEVEVTVFGDGQHLSSSWQVVQVSDPLRGVCICSRGRRVLMGSSLSRGHRQREVQQGMDEEGLQVAALR